MSLPPVLPWLGERYEVLRKIGEGGMGQVYLAQDTKHGRHVAIKVLRPEHAQALGRQRFLREIHSIAALTHPNVVPLHDSGEEAGQLFYVMPFFEGETLRQRLQRETMLPLQEALQWADDAGKGLAAAHSHGILHRDVKPENLLVFGEHILIADFGIAGAIDRSAEECITGDQLVVGTPLYTSPEQASGGKLDVRTDLYSLACVVHEMLSGEAPYTGSTAQSVLAKKMAGRYPGLRVVRPAVPAAVEKVLARALAPIPADRFQSIEAFSSALRAAAKPSRVSLTTWLVSSMVVGAIGWAMTHPTSREPEVAARPRVVVGSFENRTADPRHDRLAFMAADWITEGLQRTAAVEVVPTPAALAATNFIRGHPDSQSPIRALARETAANLVVTGAIYDDGDSLVFQAQLADAEAGRLIGAVEPVRAGRDRSAQALQELRTRLMGLLVLNMDDRAIRTELPPTFAAYQAFSEGMDAYLRNENGIALKAFELAYERDTTFVLTLLYAAFCHTNRLDWARADSVLRLAKRQRHRLNEHDRNWLDYQQSELAGDQSAALAAIRRAAELAPASKASYNFAVTAFEARQPVPAESALRTLSPDVGPMRAWFSYWDVLTSTLHAMEDYGTELEVAREARRRFPQRMDVYAMEGRALAAQGSVRSLEEIWSAIQRRGSATPGASGDVALEVGSELQAHGELSRAAIWFERAHRSYGQASGSANEAEARWGLARAAAALGHLQEAVGLTEGLPADSRALRYYYQGHLGILKARLGARDEARQVLERLAADRQPYTRGEPQFQAGRIAAELGDTSRASSLLTSALSLGYIYDLDLHRDRSLARLRGSRVLEQLGPRK